MDTGLQTDCAHCLHKHLCASPLHHAIHLKPSLSNSTHSSILQDNWRWCLGKRLVRVYGRVIGRLTYAASSQLDPPLQTAPSDGTKGPSAICMHSCIRWIKWMGKIRSIHMHSLKFQCHYRWENSNITNRACEFIWTTYMNMKRAIHRSRCQAIQKVWVFVRKKIILRLWAAQNRPPSNQIPVTHNTNGFQVWSCQTAPPGGQEVQNVSFQAHFESATFLGTS